MDSSWIQTSVDENNMNIYSGSPTSRPQEDGQFPAIIVAQAAGGVDEFIQDIVGRLSAEGYIALAPDLYHRTTPQKEQSTGKTRRQLLVDHEIVRDINATVQYLQQDPLVDNSKIGITGFCMGGRVTWLAAVSNPHFKAAVPFYGGFIFDSWGDTDNSPFELSFQLNCPMMFHFGSIDPNPSIGDMKILDEELTRLDKPHQFFEYPDANHRFMDHTFDNYQAEAANLSWSRTLDFFRKHLTNS